MSSPKSTTHDFSVFRFSLDIGSDGRPIQRATTGGVFATVGAALEHARRLAGEEAQRLVDLVGQEPEDKPVALIDTEWGYDVQRGWLVVTRFWVHDASPSRLMLAGL